MSAPTASSFERSTPSPTSARSRATRDDVPVLPAKRLLRLDTSVTLAPGQRSTYPRAMRMSDQKGPYCWPCWRWNAFRGLSKFLIARRGWPAVRFAVLVDALEGLRRASRASTARR